MILCRPLPLVLIGVVSGLLLAGCGGDDEERSPKRVTINVSRKVGTRVRANAAGFVNRPAAVAIRVSSAPPQQVIVSWGLSCPRSERGKDRGTGGSYVVTPPNVRALRLPQREIAFCAVRGEARLSRKGRVKVTLIGSER
ncbi:MAG TPA: hypothetical protein VGO80_16465 [Solirubrobacteraceae bacterium]|nr:hypothetical protein [Solirubrobacteraceae bacterium]